MLKAKHILVIGFLSFIANSCKKENLYDCFKPTGPIEIRDKELSGFKRVEVYNKIDLYLEQGSNFQVKIEAGKHVQQNIICTIKDSVLMIENINKCNFVRSPKKKIAAYVTLPYLRSIRSGGTGSVYFTNRFVQDSLEIRVANSGDVHFNADLKFLSTSTHGNGNIYGEGFINYSSHYTNGTNLIDLKSVTIKDRIDINTHTVGNCYINAPLNGPMKIEIWEKGDVYYKGNPTSIELTRHAKGDLIKE